MKFVVVGYGKVGQKLVDLCLKKGIEVKAVVSPHNPLASHKELGEVSLSKDDIVIDFSHYSAVIDHTKIAAAAGCKIVMGTAGWHEHEEMIKNIVESKNIGLVYSHNFMESAHIFWQTVASLAQKIKQSNEKCVAWVSENRISSASREYSSTAFHTAELIAQQFGRIASIKRGDEKSSDRFVFLESVPNGKNSLDIRAHFQLETSCLKLHFLVENSEESAIKYAEGAIKAAQWIQGKQGVLEFTF